VNIPTRLLPNLGAGISVVRSKVSGIFKLESVARHKDIPDQQSRHVHKAH